MVNGALVASATRVFPFAGACAIPATARGISAGKTTANNGIVGLSNSAAQSVAVKNDRRRA